MTIVRREPPAGGTLESRAEALWARLLAEQPDLSPAVGLQRTFVRTQLAALTAMKSCGVAVPDLRRMAAHLEGGRPALAGEALTPPDLLGPLVWKFARDMAGAGAGEAAAHLVDTLAARRLDGLSIVRASLARDACAFRIAADQLSLSPDLLWLAGEMAAAPYAHLCAQAVVTAGDPRVDAALQGWARGQCPICGSWPAIVEAGDGGRTLRCSFCAAGWRAREGPCLACGAPDRLETTPCAEHAGWSFEACAACDTYFKIVTLDDPLVFPLQAIEDLATSPLDRAAIERGLHRPSLPELARTDARDRA
jgi:formate dehydrogenase maturation protein FdhE